MDLSLRCHQIRLNCNSDDKIYVDYMIFTKFHQCWWDGRLCWSGHSKVFCFYTNYSLVLLSDKEISLQFVRRANGNELAILDGQTFYKDVTHRTKRNHTKYRCTRAPCKARFIVDDCLNIQKQFLSHFHNPPNFLIRDGTFYKL